MKHVIISLLIFVFPVSVFGQDIDKAKLDAFFDALESNNQGMGSFSLYRDGEEVYRRSIGFANVEKAETAGPATVYRIGSISKTFTATLILQLVEEGALSLETPLSEFYPQLPNADKITIEQLLRHQSGLYNFTNAEDYPSFMESPMSEEELIELFVENGSEFEPGEKFQYSNTNYVLLSFIIEKASGHPYPEVLNNRIAGPANLEHTYYGEAIGSKPGEAFSYTFDEDWKPGTETDMSIPQGAGAIVSTAGDINRFLVALFSGKLVSEASLEKMKTIDQGYGLGMFQFPFGEKKAYGHSGGIDAFQSMAGYFPEEKISISYLSNGVVYPVNSVMVGALNIVFEQPFEIPDFQEREVSQDILERYVGTYKSPDLPIDLKIFREGNKLMGQGTGQPPFQLISVSDTTFEFRQAGLSIEFKPEEDTLILSQGGGSFEMTRGE